MVQDAAVVNKLLTDVSNKIVPQGLIGDEVLPTKKVDHYTGLIGSYGNEHLRIQQSISADENGFATAETTTYNTNTYSIDAHGLKGFVYPKDYANVIKPFDAEKDRTALLTTALMLGREKAIADVVTSTSIITNNVTLSGNNQYNNRSHADSTPIDDWDTARLTVYEATGMVPNAAIVPWKVYNKLKKHNQLLSELGYKENRAGGLSLDELAEIMEVDKVFVPKAVYNSANKGQSDSIDPVWGNDILFYVRPDQAGLEQKSLGYNLRLRKRANFQTFKYNHDEPAGSKKIVVENHYDDYIQDATCGYLIKAAIA